MKIYEIRLWANREDVKLTTFITEADPFLGNPVRRPAVIVCPGGGYKNCPRHGSEGDPAAMIFAADGYQAFVLEYSTADNALPEQTRFPAQLLDLGKAILMIREHAQEWLVDSEKISVVGFSAGAHLCGMLATMWHEKILSEYYNVPAQVFRPLSAILIYPVTDLRVQDEHRKRTGMMEDFYIPVLGEKNPEEKLLKAWSPVCHVSEKTVPIFLAAARDDALVPARQSLEMAAELQKNGVEYELHMFEYGDHGFALGRNIFEPFRHERSHACSQWIPMAKTFLMHHISPETTEYEKNVFKDITFK